MSVKDLIANRIQCCLIENRKHRGYREPWVHFSYPFSRWLLQNREVLEKSVPGIYYQMLKRLWYGCNLIEHINLLLEL